MTCRRPRRPSRADSALAEMRLRRATGHQPGCQCASRDVEPGRLAGGCRDLAAIVRAAGRWSEIP